MRFAIDGTAAVTGGGITYLMNLLPALAEVDTENEYWIYLSTHQEQLDLRLPSRFHVQRIKFPNPTLLSRVAWQQMILPLQLHRRQMHALLAPHDIAPLLSTSPIALAIRNSNPYWGLPASTMAGRVRETLLRYLTLLSSRKATRVIFVSEFSRKLIDNKLGIDHEKTAVIYHGLSESFTYALMPSDNSLDTQVSETYILCVSAIRIHKDLITLIEAYHKLQVGGSYTPRKLLIAGAVVDEPYYQLLQESIKQKALQDHVCFLGELPYAEMPRLYRNAMLFVFPSLAETFGHPLLEAMASGVPVIATDLPVTREICRDAAHYYQPGDAYDLAERMRYLLKTPGVYEQTRQAGLERSKDFSWHKTALRTRDLLKGIARLEDGA